MSVTLLSTAPTSAAPSANGADGNAATLPDHGNAGNFLALLNASVASQFGSMSFVSGNNSHNGTAVYAFETAALTGPLSGSPPIAPTPPQHTANPDPQTTQQTSPAPSAPPSTQQGTGQSTPNDHPSRQSSSDTSGNNQNSTDNSTGTSQQTGHALHSQKQLRSALQDQLSNIDQILSSIIQLLTASAAASPVPVTAQATGSGTPAANATDGVSSAGGAPSANGSNLLPTLPSPAGQLLPIGNTATSTTTSPANELTLLQNLQTLVEQLQQALQDSGTTASTAISPTQSPVPQLPIAGTADNTGTANTTQNTPVIPADTLEQTLAQLSQLLLQQKSGNTAGTPATPAAAPPSGVTPSSLSNRNSSASGTSSASPAGNIVSLIKSSIAGVRQQLQSLNGQNEAFFLQIQNNAQALGFDPRQLLNNALSGSGLTLKDNTTQLAVSYSGAAASQTQNTPALPPAGNTQSNAVFAISMAQQGGDNAANSDSGNNSQGQAQAQPGIQAGATQSPTATAVSGANFSKALQQASTEPLPKQIAFQVKTAVSDGSSKITIQLHPEDLGKVDIKLSVDADGKTSVIVTADNHHTLDLLQRDAQGLSQALNDAGLKTDSGSLSFNLSSGQQQQQQAGGQTAQPVITYQNAQPEEEQTPNLTVLTRSYVVNVAEGLDIQI